MPSNKANELRKQDKNTSQDKTGKCALCRQTKLLHHSHIIPEFLYKPLYNSNHQFFRLSTGERPKKYFEQKGVREWLLCGDCEGQFSVYETYAQKVIQGGTEIEVLTNAPNAYEFRVDYKKFKLFELSILWRVGVSSLPEFNNARLGCHRKVLRKMLLEERPGDSSEYGCVLIWPISHRIIMDEIIHSMGMVRIKGVSCCRLTMAGMCWFFFLSKNIVDEGQRGLFLQNDGALRIIAGNFGAEGYLTKLAMDTYKKNPHLFGRDK